MRKPYQVALGILALCLAASVQAQTKYGLDNSNTTITIAGTSTLHDWESNVEEASGSATIVAEESKLNEIQALDVRMVVKSIKSGKNGMDKNTYAALKESDHPAITYKLLSASIKNATTATTTGDLTIAGKTRRVNMDVTYTVSASKVDFKGEAPLKMTDFGIDPPTAMLGSIKTGDDITIRFNAQFKR